MVKPEKILIGQLNSFGDCLFATTVARQIKNDFPNCHLTWAIGSMCRSILDGNPYIDDVWEIPLRTISEVAETWPRFESEARDRKEKGDFDKLFLTQIAPGNLHNYDGLIRSSIFRAYPYPITVPVDPVLNLTPQEIENVRLFAEDHHLDKFKDLILFECSPKSGQSFVSIDFALEASRALVSKIPTICIVLSSNIPIATNHARIIDGSVLSFRENAELTNYCSLLVGCSSGISWLSTSCAAKRLPMIQLIKPDAQWHASMVQDFNRWGLSTEMIIEMSECAPPKLVSCIDSVIRSGFRHAKPEFHEKLPPNFTGFNAILTQLLQAKNFTQSYTFVRMYFQVYGFNRRLIFIVASCLFHISTNAVRNFVLKK